jgi:hypothetical protein
MIAFLHPAPPTHQTLLFFFFLKRLFSWPPDATTPWIFGRFRTEKANHLKQKRRKQMKIVAQTSCQLGRNVSHNVALSPFVARPPPPPVRPVFYFGFTTQA